MSPPGSKMCASKSLAVAPVAVWQERMPRPVEDLRKAVVEGRRKEYPQHDWDGGLSPIDPEAFYSAKIGKRSDGNESTLDWYRQLIRVRKSYRESGLLSDNHLEVVTDLDRRLFQLRYGDGLQKLCVIVRLSPDSASTDPVRFEIDGDVILNSESDAPWTGTLKPNHAVVVIDA